MHTVLSRSSTPLSSTQTHAGYSRPCGPFLHVSEGRSPVASGVSVDTSHDHGSALALSRAVSYVPVEGVWRRERGAIPPYAGGLLRAPTHPIPSHVGRPCWRRRICPKTGVETACFARLHAACHLVCLLGGGGFGRPPRLRRIVVADGSEMHPRQAVVYTRLARRRKPASDSPRAGSGAAPAVSSPSLAPPCNISAWVHQAGC